MGNPFQVQETPAVLESAENPAGLNLLSVADLDDLKNGSGKDLSNESAANENVPPLEIDFGNEGMADAAEGGDSPSGSGAGAEEFILDVAMEDLLRRCGELGPDAAACVKSIRRNLS